MAPLLEAVVALVRRAGCSLQPRWPWGAMGQLHGEPAGKASSPNIPSSGTVLAAAPEGGLCQDPAVLALGLGTHLLTGWVLLCVFRALINRSPVLWLLKLVLPCPYCLAVGKWGGVAMLCVLGLPVPSTLLMRSG